MKRAPGQLRVIGGEFRSRIFEFEAAPGMRATPDRVRQTLFDWLAPMIGGARCLDLFAGSGALGIEALSRGAGHVTFVETGAKQAAMVRAALEKLGVAGRAEVRNEDALGFVAAMGRSHGSTESVAAMGRSHGSTESVAAMGRSHIQSASRIQYDVAFLDPPFDSDLLAPALAALPAVLAPGARVYAEWHEAGNVPWPAGYTVLREKKAGQVSYALATYSGPSTEKRE